MSLSPRSRLIATVLTALVLLAVLATAAAAQRAIDLEEIKRNAPPPPPKDPTATLSILLSPSPTWTSGDAWRVSTGGALADIDGDLDLDFVVSNGNDISEDPQVVYKNLGAGLELMPSWVSADNQYSGHCAVGDVTGDGAPELVVANYGGGGIPFDPERLILYRNLGTDFETLASWQSIDLDNSFSLALGDVDLDADLDLAVANGEAYSNRPADNELYLNLGGMLDTAAGWHSTEVESSYDVAWADVDRDGDLDLATINAEDPVRLYDNQAGVLGTTAIWSSTIAENGNSLAFADVNGDGYLDLAVATNRQGTGVGYFHVFMNQSGVLETSPSWTSTVGMVYGSAVAFADLDADGDEDLLAGSWWGQLLVFENQGGTLTTGAVYVSSTSSVIEAIVPGDLDGDGLLPWSDSLPGDGARRLFYVSRRPIQQLTEVRADGVPLGPGDFAVDLDAGWISLAVAPQTGLAVDYVVSDDLDVAVTNWDSSRGNYVFDNQRQSASVATGRGLTPGARLSVFPLPARASEWLTVSGAPPGAEIRLVTVSGRLAARLDPGADGTARYRPERPGVLLVQVVGRRAPARKLIVLP
jgi:hypothetical protein